MVGAMSTGLATGFCGCGGIAAGVGWRLTTMCASGPKVTSFLVPQQQSQYGVNGANSMPRKEFRGVGGSSSNGLGLGRRGGEGFLWLLARASAGDKSGYSDGGGDLGGGNGLGRGGGVGGVGGGGGGGGGGRGGGDGGGPGPLGGDAANFFPQAGAALWFWYNGVLETHPLVSKSLTAGLLNVIADLFCQVFIEKVDTVDWKRLMSFSSIGIFLSGPGLHFWYGALPLIVTVPGFGGVLIRIALDQLIFTPLGMVTFFVVLLTLEDRKEDIREKLEKDWWPTVVANWKVWIPFQIVNFGFVPPQLQVAAAGLLGMAWSVFISYKGHT